MNKRELSERDICTKFITPALERAGWDAMSQIREELTITKGRIIVRGKLITRGKVKRAAYVLYHRPHLPIAPFSGMGTPVQLLKRFGGPEQFAQAVHELQEILYQETAA